MKKNCLTLLVFMSLTLFGCGIDKFSPYNEYIADTDEYLLIEGDNFYKPSSYTREFKEIYQDYPFNTYKKINMPSVGKNKLLVIPVDFADYSCEKIKLGCSVTKMQIQNTFFGKSKTAIWESVASFYNKTSFGKLKIEGEVADWFTTSLTIDDIRNDDVTKSKMNTIADEASKWYQENYTDYIDYDTDKDGFIDAVAFIYATKSAPNTAFWAYASSFIQQTNADVNKPLFKNYMWASYDFMDTLNSRSKVDARIFIHETGHLFGLTDYYSSDSKQRFNPTGKMDMMDLSLGDHNTFSKMLLSWTRPYVATNSLTMRIKPSQINGECILLANNWNGSAMDEYLLIEYYTPTGLNKYHSTRKYSDGINTFSLMNKAGVKIMHVDARIGYYTTVPQIFIGYEESVDQSLLDYYDSVNQLYVKRIAHSNTLSESPNKNPLIHVLESNNKNTFSEGGYMKNESLFHQGDQFKEFILNDGEKLKYEIEIGELNKDYAEIIITYKE